MSVLAKVQGGDFFAPFHAVATKRRSRILNSQFGLLGLVLCATTTAVFVGGTSLEYLDTISYIGHVVFILPPFIIECVRKVAVHIGYGTYIWLSVSNLPLQCVDVSLYSVVNQRLKCNTGKVCNFLIQFLLTVILSIEGRVVVSAQRLS
jgi:hypothetical protein